MALLRPHLPWRAAALAGWLAAVLSWALLAPAMAAPALQAVSVGAGEPVQAAPGAQLLEDPSRVLSLAAVQAHGGWTANAQKTLNFGFSRSVWWVRLRLHNPGAQPQELVLDAGAPVQDVIELYATEPGGAVTLTQRSGDRLPFAVRPMRARSLAFPLRLEAGQTRDVYLRVDTHDGLYEALPMRLLGREAYAGEIEFDNLIQGLYYGGLLALGLYNLLLYASTRNRGFGLYVGYMMAFLLWSFTLRGFSLQYLWPQSPALNNQILAVAASLSIFLCNLFAVEYVRLGRYLPRWLFRTVKTLIGLNLLPIPLALLDQYALTWVLLIPLAILMSCTTITICAVLAWRGVREALFYLMSFLLLTAGACLNLFQLLSILPAVEVADYVWQVGSVFEMLLLAFAVADSMNQMKAQKLRAEQAAGRAQAVLAGELERQVLERTAELGEANRLLKELSITDELTGAFNRRHFNALCRQALERQSRGEQIALCMFDIDFFKAFNDLYGHQAGDHALRSVASLVQGELQRAGDRLFRLGGEEFGALLTASTPEKAGLFVERLRAAVHTLGLPHSGSPSGMLTASFGAAWWGGTTLDTLTPDLMYAEVDQLLYEAKHAGRDRVVFKVHGQAPPEAVSNGLPLGAALRGV